MFLFFFNDTATTEIYTLSLHDALPISVAAVAVGVAGATPGLAPVLTAGTAALVGGGVSMALGEYVSVRDRKSTRLNSSHANISYAVFCLKKKKKEQSRRTQLEVARAAV